MLNEREKRSEKKNKVPRQISFPFFGTFFREVLDNLTYFGLRNKCDKGAPAPLIFNHVLYSKFIICFYVKY